MLYGLLLPPLVWAIQLYLNFGLASHACFPGEAPRATFVHGWERTWSLLLVVNLLCAAICAIGLLASGYSWHRLRDEYPGEGKVDWRRLPFPGTLEILCRRRGDDERSVHGRHLVRHHLPLGALDMLTGLIRRAMRPLLLALIGSAASAQETVAPLAPGSPAHGAELIAEKGCGACHMIPGITGANGLVGPPLTLMGRRIFVAGLLRNTPQNLAAWVLEPQRYVPGNAMPSTGLTESEALDVAAYLETIR